MPPKKKSQDVDDEASSFKGKKKLVKKAAPPPAPPPLSKAYAKVPPPPPTPPQNSNTDNMEREASVSEASELGEGSLPPSKKKAPMKKAVFKGKKKFNPMEQQFEQALQSTKDLEEDYSNKTTKDSEEDVSERFNLLQEIKTFNKSKLKNYTVKDEYYDSEASNITTDDDDNDEDFFGKKAPAKQITVSQNALCYTFWDGQAYPIHRIKHIVLQIAARAEVTLDFTGIAQVTDVVFAVMSTLKDAEAARFKAVKRIILDGCYLITDKGLAWMAEAFSNIIYLSIIGCNKVTDAGLIALSKKCPKLLSIDLSSTSVNFLPKRWETAEGMKMTGSPILYPLAPADVKSKSKEPLKEDKKNLVKVCILNGENISASVLSAIKGEKQPAKLKWPRIEPEVAVGGDLMATVVETDQYYGEQKQKRGQQACLSQSGLNLTDIGELVAMNHFADQSVMRVSNIDNVELKDKTKLHDEAASVIGLVLEILGKCPNVKFLIVGCSTDAAGIVPMDFLKEEVDKYLKKITDAIKDTNYSLAGIEQMSVSKQLEYSTARRLYESAVSATIDVVEINVDKGDKEKEKLVKELTKIAEKMDKLQEVTYSKQIYQWAKEFHTKCPKALETGVHTLNAAAEAIAASSTFKERLRHFGAVHFLVTLGKLTMWKNYRGETQVANSKWLCDCLSTVLSPSQDSMQNKGQDYTIADEAMVWDISKLEEDAKKNKLDWNQVKTVMRDFPYLWLPTSTSVTTLDKLPDQSVMPTQFFTEFDKKSDEGGYHMAYSFVLNQNMTPALLQEILATVLQLHKPIHVWKTGVIIYDGIVAVMLGQTGYSKVLNLCAYMTSISGDVSKGADPNAKLIYNTIEKYKMTVEYVLTSAGQVFEALRGASVSIQVPPEGVSGVISNHVFKNGEAGPCHVCAEMPSQAAIMANIQSTLQPAFLNSDSVKGKEMKGSILGSVVELTGPCDVQLKAMLDPLGCQQCSVLLLQGNVRLLKIFFTSPLQDSICIDLPEKKIHTVIGSDKKSKDISSILGNLSLQGEVVTAQIKGDNPFEIAIYLGPRLLETIAMPFSRYGLKVSSEGFSTNGNSAMFTLCSTNIQGITATIQKGMRLEAVDRLNPSLICVATIDDVKPDTGEVHLHFDGWNNKYDYWTNFDHEDLHPIGYMQHKGHEQRARRKRTDLQIPLNYTKEFDWLTYLKEVDAEPVPYELFNEKQTEGTPGDITEQLQLGLGTLASAAPSDLSKSCKHNVYRGSRLEQQVKQHVAHYEATSQDFDSELSMKKMYVCLLPPGLSVESLRYPTMSSVYSDKSQNLHFLCPGQVLDLHHVNHEGLPMATSELADFKQWMGGLLSTYSHLMTQKHILPRTKSAICAGAHQIPEGKDHHLDAALKRLYNLYLMHALFYWTKQQELNAQQNGILETKIEAALKEQTFAQQFIQIPGTTSVLCHAHKMANSPSAQIQTISMDTFKGLSSNIYMIHLEGNPLSELPADFFDHFLNVTQLWLDNCQIAELPALKQNTCLEEIHIKNNVLAILPDDIKQLSNLKILDLSNNPLLVLPPVVSSLESLTELYIDNIGTVDLNIVCALKNLTKLSAGQNYIEEIPDKFSTLSLVMLDMSGLPLMSTGSSFTVTLVNNFLDKYNVYRRLTAKERQEMIEKAENLGEQSSNTAKITEFNRLLFEKYPRLGTMKNQKERTIPDAILNIKTLEKLIIPYQAFTFVPDNVKNLVKLEYLSVGNNPCLEKVSAELARLPLKELHLRDCISLNTPPKEVVRRGFLAVFGYLKRLLQGFVSCKRTKLMMVGLGGAGKTSLVRALTNKHFRYYEDYGENITDGIDITEWKVDISDRNLGEDTNTKEPLHFSVWDFAGQTVYYNTHQFFLSNRAVYLLLWNIRLGYEHAGLDFWLSSVACHAPKAPIIVVGTHCDKVEKGKLPMEELKRRFPQIVRFHFVSSYSGEGINDLKETLITSALEQKYMGEMIPEALLSLEKRLEKYRKDKAEALLPWSEVEEIAATAGIFDMSELIQAVQFLHDLGSVQFFNTPFLRSHVVIVPQWIVDVMACIVTVHEGPTKNGKLLYSDMPKVWKDYPVELHPWLLRLTEEFDLTFPLSSEEANIVPCLLPATEPQYDFAPVDKEKNERESRMIYRFEYLPAGLFNRAQVRLHQFSDSSVMWKKGFMLKKNNHRALLLQVSNTEVVVTARGYKPENTLFLVHEVFECLISDSYSGVSYDYSIPCAECVAEFTLDPCMFPASKIKRAFDMKAPFLQCDKNFHIISIPEIQATMPPDAHSDFDEHLGRSVRELQDLEATVAIRVLFIYSKRNIPDLANTDKVVNPTEILEDLRTAGFSVSYCDDPETANMESMTLSIKSAQVVVFGISDEFVENAAARNLIIYTKQTLHKNMLLIALGKTLNWQKTDINLVLADEVFVKMTQAERYSHKFPELCESIRSRSQRKKIVYPECFISYCWANSKTAVELGSATKEGALGWGDPRKIKEFLQSKGVNCWLDVEQMGQEGFFEDIADGLRKAKVMIAFVSDEYADSKNCRMEFRFAVSTLKIPTILAVVGTGYKWERTEIGLLTVGHSQSCPKINLQYENEAGLLDLLKEVQNFLPKSGGKEGGDFASAASQQTIAFQEVLELTQRKLLRHISMFSETMDMEPYPRLVLIDLKVKDESKDKDSTKDAGNSKCEKKDDGQEAPMNEDKEEKSNTYCFRLLCEHEQGWHESPYPISFPAKEGAALEEFLKNVSPYVARVLAILKHSKINLQILNTPHGEQIRKMMEEWCTSSTDFQSEYSTMVQTAIDEDVDRTYGGLKRCHMPNGKILWLCDKHESSSFTQTEEKYKDQLTQGQGQNEDSSSDGQLPREDTFASSTMDDASSTASSTAVPAAEIPGRDSNSQPQVAVKMAQPAAGQPLPRKPKLRRHGSSSRKTTSQACLLM